MRLRFWIGLVVARACLATTIVPVHAALITYDSRALFDAAAPGLAIETFESGLVAPGAVATCSGPVSSAAASTCFPFGSLLPGVTYSAASGGSLVLIGSGFPPLGTTSKVFGPNLFTDTFDMRFV